MNTENLTAVYTGRFEKLWDWMAQEGVALVMLEDNETRRDSNICYLSGHPCDALLFVTVDKKAVLAAWDINLAKVRAQFSPVTIKSYNDFDREPRKALKAVLKLLGVPYGVKIEIPAVTPYPVFLDYVGELADYDVLCREKSAGAFLRKMRAIKNEDEIAVYRKATAITNELIDIIENNVRNGKIKTEADAALLIETESRKLHCEGTSFGTLAAGPERSFNIHAIPGWTNGPFAGTGLSILDFGVKYQSYCTDVTLTFCRNLNPKQEKMTALVEKASKLALSQCKNGIRTADIAASVDALFSKSKKQMPHGLGHGIGLQEHEYPVLRNYSGNEWVLEPGMIFTVEPGLYDHINGGCRLENDVLMTDKGAEVFTNSRIIRL
jgi:Xaa-Pro dipeptidase